MSEAEFKQGIGEATGKTVEELTRNLAVFDPKDPCKYDFSLFGIGEEQEHGKQ